MRLLNDKDMYKTINDYELIYLISDNNDDNYGIILNKYDGLIRKVINKYKFIVKKMGYEEEDLYQECSYALYKAICRYDGYVNNNLFYTYILKVLENTIFSIMKINNTNKKKVLNESISYDNTINDSPLTYIEVFQDSKTDIYNGFIDYQIFYINLKNSFEYDISCVFELKVEGYTNKEISQLLELNNSFVNRAIKLIKQKLLY